MPQLCLAFPTQGKTEEIKRFVKTMTGQKKKDYAASDKRRGIRKQTWFLQSTPVGDVLLMYLEADNVTKALRTFATDKDSFSVWARKEMRELTGIDFSHPPKGPLAEQLFKHGY